jgi:adenosine deaminase
MGQVPQLMEHCARQGVGVEMCPVSNLQTKATPSWQRYPLPQFMAAGIPVSINTDNRTVSSTCLTREFTELQNALGITRADVHLLYDNAVQTSFASEAQKRALRQCFVAFEENLDHANPTAE